jgi:serine/threonine protein kinase
MVSADNNEPILIDFGFSTFYVDENKAHVPNTEHISIVGSPKYMSINLHNNETPSRRDDLISLIYMFIEIIFCIVLPWNGDICDLNKIREQKQINNLAENYIAVLPLLKYVYNIKYDNAPNYYYIKELLSCNCNLP